MEFPRTDQELEAFQERVAVLRPVSFSPPPRPLVVAGVFVCFGRGGSGTGATGDVGWAAAVVMSADRRLDACTITGAAGGPYQPGLLALREGPLLASAVETLTAPFDVLLVNASGRDHPRRAGLALHLGSGLDVPSVGVTHRPLLARGPWPNAPDRGARTPLRLNGALVGYWVRTRARCRPIAIHAAWRTDPDIAARLALELASKVRTPEPLREARRLARSARASHEK